MRTLIATLSPDLENKDICNQLPVLKVIDITPPQKGEKILAFEFDRFAAKRNLQVHIGSAILSEIKKILTDFIKEYGANSVFNSSADSKEIYIKFCDNSEIQITFFQNYSATYIKPKPDSTKLYKGYIGTRQYIDDEGNKKIFENFSL